MALISTTLIKFRVNFTYVIFKGKTHLLQPLDLTTNGAMKKMESVLLVNISLPASHELTTVSILVINLMFLYLLSQSR